MMKLSQLRRKIKLAWVVPIVLCYLVSGFLVYAGIRLPDYSWVCAVPILATALLTITWVLILNPGGKK